MNKLLTSRQLSPFGVPLLLCLVVVWIAKSGFFNVNTPALSFGITFDLVLTIPVVYFLLIRKTGLPKITVLPFFMAGIVVATLLLPPENQLFLRWLKTWILPVVEATVLVLVVYKARLTIKQYRTTKVSEPDFFTILKSTCSQALPTVPAILFATELAVLYYGFIQWKGRVLRANEFTYHKNSGIVALLIALIFIVGIETFVLHLVLIKWNVTAAWIMTGLSIYAALQLFGCLKSILHRPISIAGKKLHLRYGILREASVDIDNIDTVELTTRPIEFSNETRKLSPVGDLDAHNVLIRLKRESTLSGLYGIKKNFSSIALFVDDKDNFKRMIEETKEPLH